MQFIVQKCDPGDISYLDELLQINGLQDVLEDQTVPEGFAGFILRLDHDGLSLVSTATPRATPTRIDFQAHRLQQRVTTTRRREGLPKAVGLDRAGPAGLSVLDATAGFATDAWLLAALGCRVTLLEKSPLVAALLADAFRRARSADDDDLAAVLDRMTLRHADAHTWFSNINVSNRPDVIYLDPMFPPRQKSALVKKDMAMLQALLEPNDDVGALLDEARQRAGKRVVLKRPGREDRKTLPKPDFLVPGKSCHFQVFLTGG